MIDVRMEGTLEHRFSSPEEEIAFLRTQIAEREKELLSRSKEVDRTDVETLGKAVVREYAEYDPSTVLTERHQLAPQAILEHTEQLKTSRDTIEEVLALSYEKGIKNTLTVLEKLNDAFVTDEVHRRLVAALREGARVADLNERMPLWKVFHMTLFEVALPKHPEDDRTEQLSSIIAGMEQFYAGMQTVGASGTPQHYTLEIAVSDKQDDIIFYAAVPDQFNDLFEKQVLSLFPHAVLTIQKNDYNIFVDGGVSEIAVAKLKKHPIYPLRSSDTFERDPLSVLLNAFSKIEREGGGAAIQFVISTGGKKYTEAYKGILKRVEDGVKTDVAIRKSTIHGELYESMKDLFFNQKKGTEEENAYSAPKIDTDTIEVFKEKLETPILLANVRVAVSARLPERARQIMTEIEASFRQFEYMRGNTLEFSRQSSGNKQRALRSFSFREFVPGEALPLSIEEIATLIHFPAEGIESSPQFKQSRAKQAPAPIDIPSHGTLIGENEYRSVRRKIFITPEDRLRHFYVIGQTGTGKSVFLQNLIVQDIHDGAGVCMIDPHGTDIEYVLGAIPPERADDVIYFDPSRTDMVMGLNMLEYDPRFPEQKTFVVNELFSIFQRLYGANPESMGPMFEQYFRNSTQLVLEDPESGSTLLDVSRVMVDAAYRRYKLSRAKNPVVVQFWREIATKAGGEAALENIVPYITSKFDVFTANDYMRPIIGQQRSAFRFRELMDSRKILLVNLSKGRLGDINANLIGMIIVGKILMAALSRVDDPTKSFPPFYLHIDEFQNVTTDSIAAILSEARKYKLGLSVAHQFIAQLDDTIRDAVFGNVGSLTAFRVGPEDAHTLEKQFDPVFNANDLMNIQNYHAYVRVLANGVPTPPFSIKAMPPPESSPEQVAYLKDLSYRTYGRPREEVEREIIARYSNDT